MSGAMLVCTLFVYMVLLMFFKDFFIIILSRQYTDLTPYIILWASVFFVTTIRYIMSYTLQILRQFKTLTISVAASAVLTLAACKILLLRIGLAGSILALLLGETVLSLLLFYFLAIRVPAKVKPFGETGVAEIEDYE
jgi:O-antigen/teichoic acid export membrane protein